MTYTPAQLPMLPMVSALTYGVSSRTMGGSLASATFESANRAVYVPVLILAQVVVRRMWWANGATVSASYNIDAGIYADAGYKPGAKLVSSGSTAQGTASQVQFVDVTDATLAPGRYWLAMACSSSSATFMRAILNAAFDASLRFEEAEALPLPSTATVSESSSTNNYVFGFATTASP